MAQYLMTHSLLSSWLYAMKESPYGNIAGIPALKTAGSLTTVLSSGVVAVIASRKAVRT